MEQLSPVLFWILLLVILCFIWKPAVNKQRVMKVNSSAIEVDQWNVLQVGTFILN